jgi:hypothetical protein
MTHASPVELHDHVYGFRPSAHVAGCPECQDRAATIAAERSAIGKALSEEPAAPPQELLRARRPRLSAAGLIAAAALLAALAWILFHERKPADSPADGGQPSQAEAIDRLIAELKSPSEARREIAVLALKAYGEAALPALAKTKIDPALFGEYRLKAFDTAVDLRIRTEMLDMDFENTALGDILQELAKKAGVKIIVDRGFRDLDLKRAVTYKVKGLTAVNCLKLLLAQFNGDFRCEEGAVVILEPKTGVIIPSAARAPVRIGRMKAAAAKLLAEFSSDSADRRAAAHQSLTTLGFAAEEALWEALDSKDPEVKGQALDLLRWLYTPADSARTVSHPRTRSVMKKICGKRVTVDYQEVALTTVAELLTTLCEENVHISGIDSPDRLLITFKGADLPVYSALVLALEPKRLACIATDQVMLITPERSKPEEEPRRPGNFWTAPGEAKTLEETLAALAGDDAAARDRATATLTRLGDRALPLLKRAAEIFEGGARERCRSLRAKILQAEDPGRFDEPLADRAQAQQEILDRKADLDVNGLGLEEILKPYGAQVEVRSKPVGTFRFQAKEVRLETVLKALTIPHGLDFTFEGERLIIEKKP